MIKKWYVAKDCRYPETPGGPRTERLPGRHKTQEAGTRRAARLNRKRTAGDIDNAVQKHLETGADSVVSVVKADHNHPVQAKKVVDDVLYNYCLEEKEGVRRQDLPPVYFRNGAFYSVKRDVLIKGHSLYGKITRPYIMPPERSVDIDTEVDFKLAELLLRRRLGR